MGRRSVTGQQEIHRERSRSEPRRPRSHERSIDCPRQIRVPDSTPPRHDDHLQHHLHPHHLSLGPVGSPREAALPPAAPYYRHHDLFSLYPTNPLLSSAHCTSQTETRTSMLDTQHSFVTPPPSIEDVFL